MTAMKLRTWGNIPMRAAIASSTFSFCGSLDRGVLQELAQLAAAGQGLGEIAHLLLRRSGIQAGRFRNFGKGARITWSGAGH